jgi:hypothetical protein
MGSGTKSYIRKGILTYEENLIFFFISVAYKRNVFFSLQCSILSVSACIKQEGAIKQMFVLYPPLPPPLYGIMVRGETEGGLQ